MPKLALLILPLSTWSGKRRFVTVKRDWRTILTLAGAVTFRRRYYLDRSTGRYTHPPDAAMGLCRYSRASADVRLKILDMAGECPYRYVGANAVPGQALSKSTVCRIIRDTAVTTSMGKMGPGKSAVHVQIDEKYISMIGKKHKSRYITATIYAGKKAAGGRNALTNRTLISGVEVADVAAKINAALSEAYGLSADSSVYLSGDLAGYIQSCTSQEKVDNALSIFLIAPSLFPGSGCLPFPGALPAPVELLRELLWGQVSEGEGRPPFVEVLDVGPDAFLDVLRFVDREIGE